MTEESPESAAATAVPATLDPPQSKPRDPFDPLEWEMRVVCKDCDKEFKVPYRHFQAGVVFHCSHCRGSYVPSLGMYRQVRETFERFFTRMRRQREQMTRAGADDLVLKQWLDGELNEFDKVLGRLAHELCPAGKMPRRKGLAAMFT
jgi:hypothetical protein